MSKRRTTAIVITTFNRCEDLQRTCTELRKLDPPANEVIICLDGCTDGSRKMLSEEFPDFTVIENPESLGSIPSRDRVFRMVQSELILSLDDDSYPTDPAFLEKLQGIVEAHPEAGAFTFPEIRNDGRTPDTRLAPDQPGCYIRDFPNCAGLTFRSLYGSVAEYPTFFRHMYEESDYSLQLYAAGYAVWFEPSVAIRHHHSSKERNLITRHGLNARNELWSVILRCPMPYLVAIAPLRVIRQLAFSFSMGSHWAKREPAWWWQAAKSISLVWSKRKAIPWPIYYNWMKLAQRPLFENYEIIQAFPPIRDRISSRSPTSVR